VSTTAIAGCSRCGRENRAGAAFCDQCGAPLGAPAADSVRPPGPAPRAGDLFVGRERELAALGTALEQALAGEGRIVALAGEPGIGKTRTAEALAHYAEGRDARVLWGRCYEEPGAPPYWPWVQVIRACAGDCDGAQLQALLGAGAGDLAEIVPELARRLPDLSLAPRPVEATQARFRLFDAIGGFWKRAAADAPQLLILDNVHWADTPSLRLLEFLAPEVGESRLLILLTYRDIELSRRHPLSDTLGALARAPRFQRLRLTGLNLGEASRFMAAASGRAVPPELVASVHSQTEGNPLFLAEVTRFLVQEGALDAEPASPLAAAGRAAALRRIPEGVKEVIGTRLNRLSPLCNAVLTNAAAIGRAFATAVLGELAAVAEDQLAGVLEEAVAAGVVEEATEPGSYQFSHALIRETLYEEIPAVRRARLHLRIGAALERLSGRDPMANLAALAHHYCAALPGGDANKAMEYAERAAERADKLFAYEEAARYCRLALQALEVAQLPDDATRRCRLLIALGEAQVKAGENLRAAEVLEEAAASARALGLSADLARAAVAFEEATWRPGIPGNAAARLLRDALAGLPDEDSTLRAWVMSSLTRALVFSGALEEAMRVHEQALAMARRLGDRGTIAAALRSVVTARWLPERYAARAATTFEATKLAQEIGDRERVLEAASWRLFDLMELGDVGTRDAEFAAYAKLADTVRQPFYQYIGVSSRAMTALFEGRFEESERLATEALEVGMRMPGLDAAGIFGMQMFTVRREQGRLKELAPAVDYFVRNTAEGAAWRPGLAVVYAELGLAERARAEFEALAADDFASIPQDGRWVTSMVYLAEVCAFLGDAVRAAKLYVALAPFDDRNLVAPPNVACFGAAARHLGMLATVMKRWADAERHFQSALATNHRQGGRPWVAHTRLEYASMLRTRNGSGDRERAIALAAEALALAREIGMQALVARAVALGEELESPPGRVRYPAGLSQREVEVLRLVAAGKGNREIAERLFVSPNTVANHVRSILTKTNTANRTEAAAFAVQHKVLTGEGAGASPTRTPRA
jgi:DNA-binding CsgD family transcriptional regulator